MLYIIWCIGAKVHVNGVAEENIKQRSISHVNILTVPTPFNTLLWRIVIVDDHSYYEGYYSLLDPSRKVSMSRHPLNRELLSGIENH
jgi:inner membrane protein